MDPQVLNFVDVITNVFPLICSIICWKRISPVYYPFIMLVWIAVIMTALLKIFVDHINILANVYVLIEPIFLLWLFYNLGRLHGRWINIVTVPVFLFCVWVVDNFLLHSIHTINSIYRVVYSFILVFIALEQINYQITAVRYNLLKEASFIISLNILVLYTYKAVFETLFMLHIQMTDQFVGKVFLILQVVQFATNVIFGVAILWMNKKQRFSLPY
jgi:hypothetical protein